MSARDKFTVGQRARWAEKVTAVRGQHVTVIEARATRGWVQTALIDGRLTNTGRRGCGFAYMVKADDGERWVARESELEPLPSYDGNQAVAWSACAWRPTTSTIMKQAAPKREIVEALKGTLSVMAKHETGSMSIFGTATLAYIEFLEQRYPRSAP